MSDYFPTRAPRQPIARMGAQVGPVRSVSISSAVARRHPLRRHAARRARAPHLDHAFQAALDHVPVADEALALIQQHVDRYAAEDFFPSAVERDALLTFLKPRPGLYARLSEMHDRGLLGRMFPEFQPIFCRVVRDFYHKYTVDEHTLLTIRNLERLAQPSTPARPVRRAAGRISRAPELLVLALLFHDVGKWRDEDHAVESVRMARRCSTGSTSRRRSRAMVEFLIAHHLQMSLVAFRRDTEDPEIVRQFADLVGIEERLKMLCLLTLVDVEAVSPETLTPWREELLWRLYVDTYNHLTLEYGDERIEHDQPDVRGARWPAGRRTLSEDEIAPVPRRPAAPVPAAVRAGGDLPARAALARHHAGPRPCRPRAERRRVGADGGHARQAVPVLEHLRRRCLRSGWTS